MFVTETVGCPCQAEYASEIYTPRMVMPEPKPPEIKPPEKPVEVKKERLTVEPRVLVFGDVKCLLEQAIHNFDMAHSLMAQEVAGGLPLHESVGTWGPGDKEFYEGLMAGSYPMWLRELLVRLAQKINPRRLIAAGEFFYNHGMTPESGPTPSVTIQV